MISMNWVKDYVDLTNEDLNEVAVKVTKAGLNVEMPFSSKSNLKKLKKQASKNKELENILDKRVDQVISTIKKYQKNSTVPFDYEKYHQKAVEIASESMILLKNDNFLPLNKDENIAYIGDFAINPRYRGGGSSAVTPYKVTNSIDDLKNKGINVNINNIIIVSSFLIDMIDIGSQLMIFRYDREGPGNKSDSLVEGERLAVNFSDKGFNITADPSIGNHSFHNWFSF